MIIVPSIIYDRLLLCNKIKLYSFLYVVRRENINLRNFRLSSFKNMLDNDIYSATIYISFFNTLRVTLNITLEEIKIGVTR